MATEFDVAVLGSGMAGSAAAIAAAAHGANVCVVTGPPGVTGMFAGAWHGSCPDELAASLANAGYRLCDVAHPLPHPGGRRLAADAATAPHAAADTHDALIIGIAGLASFNAEILAQQWAARAGTTVLLDGTPAAGWSAASLATLIQSDTRPLITALRAAAQTHRAQRLIVPAILGMQSDPALHAQIQDALGMPIGEALGVPPSLPGWRLHLALRNALAHARVTTIEHKVNTAVRKEGRIDALTLATGDVVRARAFVLATGKYAAGGIEANGEFREPALACPVWIDHLGDAFDEAEPLILTDPDRTQDQPLLRAGVHADAEHRPLDRKGDVFYANVHVAGTIRAGWSAGHYGIGTVAQDGWNAGLKAMSI